MRSSLAQMHFKLNCCPPHCTVTTCGSTEIFKRNNNHKASWRCAGGTVIAPTRLHKVYVIIGILMNDNTFPISRCLHKEIYQNQ